jgi:hypothetical protein
MTPAPPLSDLVASVEVDAATVDPLAQLSTATATAADLTRSGDDLIGHFVDRCRQAGHTWAEISDALGVSRQAAHKRFTATGAPSLERFTPRAEEAFRAATTEAHALGHAYIGTEHVLLGLFTPPGSIAAHLLAGAGLTHDDVVERVVARAPRGAGSTGTLPLTPRAVSVLGGVLSSALSLGHNYIGTEHLLLGLHREPEGIGAGILVEAGLDHETARSRIIAVLSGFTGQPA